jgi:hypothetical protein
MFPLLRSCAGSISKNGAINKNRFMANEKAILRALKIFEMLGLGVLE